MTDNSKTFRNQHLEILSSLKTINFKHPDTISSFNLLQSKNIISHTTTPSLNDIQKYYHKDQIYALLEQVLFTDIKCLLNHHESTIGKLNTILMHENIIQKEYADILFSIKNNEIQINDFIEFYSEYLKDNKGFLIRNEILKTFLDKVMISKEEIEHASTADNFGPKFFNCINKMVNLKEIIETIQKNANSFSKTLLMSIKEHYNLIDEMWNEGIVVYLKTTFRSKKIYQQEEFNKINELLNYIRNKDTYMKFVLNEYTQMRKKFIEEQWRNKYIKLLNVSYDEIFTQLNEDFIFYFMKEFILINYFFDTPTNTVIKATLLGTSEWSGWTNTRTISQCLLKNDMFYLVNYIEGSDREGQLLKDNMSKIGALSNEKDLNTFIINLNSILYIFEDLFYQNTNLSVDFFEIYKITLLSYYYTDAIEDLFKENKLDNISLKLSVIISNYKKTFSSWFKKKASEGLKTLQKWKNNLINYLNDSHIIVTNESVINQAITQLVDCYIKIFRVYHLYKIKKRR